MLSFHPHLLEDAQPIPTQLTLDTRLWNWRQDLGDNAPIPANYYEASLAAWPGFTALENDAHCDVLVIGGGLLGLSTALHLAQAGVDVLLLEKHHVGAGASGRNGGQLTPGLARWEAADMMANLPQADAQRLWRFASFEAMALLREIASRYGMDFDHRPGHITAAVHPGHMSALIAGADARLQLGDASVDIVGRYELQQHICSPNYHGGTVDHLGGQIHPLALLRGMANALLQHGGRIHEQTEVLKLDREGGTTRALTPQGVITARQAVVMAVHDSTFQLAPDVGTTVPFHTYVGVTPPLVEDVGQLLPSDMAVYDTQFQIDYYRRVRHNRLLFGGQGTGTSWSPERINDYLLARIRMVFPQIAEPSLEYSWSGISDATVNGATDCRKLEDGAPVYLVHGWSGHGVAQTVRIGKAISDDFIGVNDDFAMLTHIEHQKIPLGRQLSPMAIPLFKAAIGVVNAVQPGRLVSF